MFGKRYQTAKRLKEEVEVDTSSMTKEFYSKKMMLKGYEKKG
ncbi:MAG: hypothetical protein CM15mV20_0960 [uncultured marine virus]|nr:MAG: hypothetical protein CM15mV20_0960 [uncultured marine virus]